MVILRFILAKKYMKSTSADIDNVFVIKVFIHFMQ